MVRRRDVRIPRVNTVHIFPFVTKVNNQPIPFPIDRDGHDFHALFQYMFYTLVQNCTRIESFYLCAYTGVQYA